MQGYNEPNQVDLNGQNDIFSANEGFNLNFSHEDLLETLNQNKEINDENRDSELSSKDEGMLDGIDASNHPMLEDLLEDKITKENNMHAPFTPEVDQKILKESVTDHPHSDTKIGVTSNVSKTITEESISSDDSEYSSKENPKKKTKRGRKAQPKKVSKSSNRQEKKMKSYLVQKDLDVKTLLSDALYNHINGCTISISDKPKRGRPKKNIEVNMKDLESKIIIWVKDLDRKIEKCAIKGRTDALDVTIKRKI